MKNASKYADELKSLLRRLMKELSPQPLVLQEPLKALVRGAMSFDVPDAKAEDAMKAIDREFVDLNELRVATELEIQELLGSRYPLIERRVNMFTQGLNDIFEREHTMSLDRLKGVSKKDARQFLRELPEIHPFVEAYVMLFGFGANAMPLDEEMLAYLREEGIFDESTSLLDAQKFIENQLKDGDSYDAYRALRRGAGDAGKVRKKAKA